MKSLIFDELLLMSQTERTARKLTFHPQLTAIVGANDTGKSSIIKQLYWTFGAEPAVFHSRWTDLNVVSMVRFKVDGTRYVMVRAAERYALFNARGICELATGRVTSELAPRLAHLLGFALRLKSRQGQAETPPPAFCFLPFYADQDQGWGQPWNSFAKLGQYSGWKPEVINYHAGIRPNEYYDLSFEKADLETQISKVEQERNALRRAIDKLKIKNHRPLTIDRTQYQSAIKGLLDQVKALDFDRQKSTTKLSVLASKRALLEQQASIAQAALGELDKDYAYIADDFAAHVTCPTCGTEHENSFVNRYSLVGDQEDCRSFLVEVRNQLDDVSHEIGRLEKQLGEMNFRHTKIHTLLEEKRGKIKLKDVIEAEGERQARQVVETELKTLVDELAKLNLQLKDLKARLSEFENADRKKAIHDYYSGRMAAYLHDMNVKNLPSSDYETIRSQVRDTGSDQSRAVLAYYFAFIATMLKYSSSPLCPIVLDTPNQQDQDPINARKIMDFIFKRRPAEAQLILGTVSLQGAGGYGKTIQLAEKYSAMRKSEYESVTAEIRPFLDALAQ